MRSVDLGGRARSVAQACERFVFAPEDPRRLAIVRILLFSLLALRLAITDYGSVAGQPAALFDPVSLFHLLPEMPSSGITISVQVVGVLMALLAASGVWPRATFRLALAAAVFLELMLNATGKIVHNDLLLVLCLLPLAYAPGASCRVYALRRSRKGAPRAIPGPAVAYGWQIRLGMVIVALAYLFAGLQKLRFSGLDWAFGDNLRWVLYSAGDGIGDFIADHSLLYHALAIGTLALELGFIACLPWPRLRWVMVPGVVSLHLGILVTMDLDYTAQAATVVIVFVNWAALADRPRWRARITGGPRAWQASSL